MQRTTVLIATALMLMQTACAHAQSSEDVRATVTRPVKVENGTVRIDSDGTVNVNDAKWLLVTSDGTSRPTEKGAYLGVGVTPVPGVVRDQLKLQRGMGLVVNFVEKDSPAQSAGVRENDILTRLDDQLLVNAQQFAVLVRIHKVNEPMKLTVIREAKPMEISAKLVERDLAVVDYSVPRETYNLASRSVTIPAQPFATPLAASPFGQGGTFQMESSDDLNSISVSRNNGKSSVVARDKEGKVLFEGPIDTDEQINKAPESIRPKLKKLREWPASMPSNTFRYIPQTPVTPSRRATGAEPSY